MSQIASTMASAAYELSGLGEVIQLHIRNMQKRKLRLFIAQHVIFAAGGGVGTDSSNVQKLIFDYREPGKTFSIQHLVLNLLQQELQDF